MKKYSLSAKIIFSGTITVDAKNKKEAAEIAKKDFWAVIGDIGGSYLVSDWDINLHPDSIAVK